MQILTFGFAWALQENGCPILAAFLAARVGILNGSGSDVQRIPGAPFLARPLREKWGI